MELVLNEERLGNCLRVLGRGFQCTKVQNIKKHRINSHPIIHCPTSLGVSEVSKRANKQMDV